MPPLRLIPLVVTALLSGSAAGAGDWWSLEPLPPAREASIDAHVSAALASRGLTPSPPADRATFIRRVTFDLTGLPPTPDEVSAFLRDDTPGAEERLVDRLLASPAHGEKWARHWLDVARFGESDGFEFDKPRPDAWRYRDWVIDALNADMPYDEFARLQVAGDVTEPVTAGGVIASSFLVCGPYDDTNRITASEALRQNMRQDEVEDIVGTVGQVFLGLTLHCARCHDHKFDPVPLQDYYRLASCFAGVQRGPRPLPAAAPAPVERRKTEPVLAWEFDSADGLELLGGAEISGGTLRLDGAGAFARTGPIATALAEKTLSVEVRVPPEATGGGGVMSVQTPDGHDFDAIVWAEREERRWMAGSEFYTRTESFGAPPEDSRDTVRLDIVWHGDGTVAAFRNGQPLGRPYRAKSVRKFEAGGWQVVFGLRHGTQAEPGRMFRGEIERAALYDKALWPKPEAPAQAYAVTPVAAPSVHVLARGNPAAPREVVAPGALSCLASLPGDFGLPPNAPEAARRRALAAWLTHRENPLFARAIVNRVWHWHFGQGLVATPNDLGRNGGEPSHPALLDWLAARFRDSGWSLKKLHRLICTSATYRQQSLPRADAMAVDAGNRLLWRFTPRRLEAEELRDAVLVVSGRLDPARGGPGFQDFRMENTANTMHYHPEDRDAPELNRRSIYRMWARGGANPLLNAFDCPDPSVSTPARATTLTPLNALTLLNSAFTFAMADHCAARVGTAPDPVSDLWLAAYGRPPTDAERGDAATFAAAHGLPALCRVVFNSGEFVYLR